MVVTASAVKTGEPSMRKKQSCQTPPVRMPASIVRQREPAVFPELLTGTGLSSTHAVIWSTNSRP